MQGEWGEDFWIESHQWKNQQLFSFDERGHVRSAPLSDGQQNCGDFQKLQNRALSLNCDGMFLSHAACCWHCSTPYVHITRGGVGGRRHSRGRWRGHEPIPATTSWLSSCRMPLGHPQCIAQLLSLSIGALDRVLHIASPDRSSPERISRFFHFHSF